MYSDRRRYSINWEIPFEETVCKLEMCVNVQWKVEQIESESNLLIIA